MEIRMLRNFEASWSRVAYRVIYDCFNPVDYRTWLRMNCIGDVAIGEQYMHFENAQDAMLFKLRFPL